MNQGFVHGHEAAGERGTAGQDFVRKLGGYDGPDTPWVPVRALEAEDGAMICGLSIAKKRGGFPEIHHDQVGISVAIEVRDGGPEAGGGDVESPRGLDGLEFQSAEISKGEVTFLVDGFVAPVC